MRILVVDDQPDLAAVIRDALLQAGFECECAGDAPAAREALARKHFDLALIDVMMPGDTGLVLAGEIAPRSVRVALMTGAAVEMPERLADACLRKPFRLKELVAFVERQLVAPKRVAMDAA